MVNNKKEISSNYYPTTRASLQMSDTGQSLKKQQQYALLSLLLFIYTSEMT